MGSTGLGKAADGLHVGKHLGVGFDRYAAGAWHKVTVTCGICVV